MIDPIIDVINNFNVTDIKMKTWKDKQERKNVNHSISRWSLI